MTRPESVRLPTAVLRQHRHALDVGLDAGDDDRVRPVDRRDVQVREGPPYLRLRGTDRQHRAARRQRLHQPAPSRDQRRRIRKAQDPSRVGSRDLADRVARDDVRLHTPGPHQRQQRHLHREDRRLRPPSLVQGGRVQLKQRKIQSRTHLIESRREHRERLIQLPAHPHPLRPLTSEHHRQATRPGRTGQRVGSGSHRRQPGVQPGAVAREEDCPVPQTRAGSQGPADLVQSRVGRDVPPETLGGLPQRVRLRRGEHHRDDGRRGDGHRSGLVRRGFEDDVSVGAADPERRHRRPPRPTRLRPRPRLRQQLHRTLRPVHLRGGCVHMQRPRQKPVPHRLHHLDDPRHTSGSLGVTDVRLDRPQPQRLPRTILTVRRQQRLRLDRITQPGPGPVRLHRVHVVDGQAGGLERGADHPLLGGAVRRGQPVGGPVLVHGTAAHHRQDRVPEPPRIRQPLHQQHADALGPAGAVGALGERLAPPIRRQPPLPREPDESVRGGHHGHPAGQRSLTLPVAYRLNGQVQRHQRRRTRRIHRHRRTLQPERVRHPPRRDAAGAARAEETLDAGRHLGGLRAVVVVHHAGEHADPMAAQPQRVDPGAFERLPGGFEQQPLLRVHRQRLAGRDPEQPRVELSGVPEETALPGVRGAGVVGIRVVEVLEVPASVLGEVPDTVPAVCHQLPQLVGGGDAARVAAGHADDRHRVVGHPGVLCERGGPLLRGGELLAEESGQHRDVRVVEDQCGGQAQSGRGGQAVAQLHRGERVEAHLAERAVGVELVR
ncbi:hypothetical protein SNL152K_10816 [Streptomyces sp. NL15-2K]|nr:hypothetical protein SNL152K_10816 [Streptomyces sp. NL15-2K]